MSVALGAGMFWKRRNRDPDPSPAPDDASALDPVRIFTSESTIDGWIQSLGQRLSDTLSFADVIRVSPLPSPNDSDWFDVEREQILLIAPPPQTGERARRLHRVKRPILVLRDHYVVQARVHLIAGIGLDPNLARSGRHFLPVTESRVTSSELPEIDERHAELLVNVRSTIGRLELTVVE